MKFILAALCFIVFIAGGLEAQDKKPEDFGYRHLQTLYKKDTVDVLVMSKKGEEQKKKPLILFDQGSLARPLILLKDNGQPFMLFPFKTDGLLENYHLVIIGKPFVPLVAYQKDLKHNVYVEPKTGIAPAAYFERDNVDYYVNRDKQVIKFLKKQPWVDGSRIVAAGHSAGSTVASKLALKSKDVTHLIYSGGNPFGRMSSMISQARQYDDSVGTGAEAQFNYWEKVVNDPANTFLLGGDPNKTTYDFSVPPIQYLRKLKIPVLITYGTKDHGVTFNDYLRLEMIKKKNFTFIPYIGVEHNYFGLKEDGSINYDDFGWDKVAQDWKEWLDKN